MIDFNSLNLDELERIAKEADQQEWIVDSAKNGAVFNVDTKDGEMSIAMASEYPKDKMHVKRKANAQHIAQFSPTVVLALLAELRRNR
jgi:hypothetical protein